MKITLEMILTRFFLAYPQSAVPFSHGAQPIYGLRLLPGNTEDLAREYLYVAGCYEESLVASLGSDLLILCLLKEPPRSAPANVILIPWNFELAQGFNILQKCYDDFLQWERQLDLALARDASFQELMDLSEEMTSSPILIYDPALKLLAYSKSHIPDDPIFIHAIRNGYLGPDTVKQFDRDRVFESLGNTGVSYGLANEFRRHADLIRAINIRNELAVYCILLYTDEFPRSYISQIFEIFCDSIQNLLQKQHSNFVKNRSVSDYFLMDLLDNPNTSAEQIQERIAYNDLDYEGNYIVISLHTDLNAAPSGNYFLQLLRNNLIQSRIFSYRDGIVILYQLPKFQANDYRAYLTNQFENILKEFRHRKTALYFSRPFTNIGLFSSAYTQAENIRKLRKDNEKQLFYFYEDYWVQDLFFMNSSKEFLFSYCDPALIAITQKGTKKSRQQLQILHQYLCCDRRLTDAAKQLHMHRNNVFYHIKSIEETYKLKLDDPAVRLKLLLSFEILKFMTNDSNVTQ